MPSRKYAFLALAAVFLPGVALPGDGIPNWPAPVTWSPQRASHGVTTLGDVSSPLPFIAVSPCRIVDTRGNGAPITGGIFTGGADVRNYAVAGICGIPAGARALSLNLTVAGPGQTGPGFLLAWPTGGAVPPVSSLNWDHVPATVGNTAVVPTNGSTSFTVNVSAPTHLIIDVNGYYAPTPAASSNSFSVINSGLQAIYGETSNTSVDAAGVYGRVSGGSANGVFGETVSPVDGSAGVYGRATSSTGNNVGVAGQTNSTADGSIGVLGFATATTGITFGVRGRTSSTTDSASGVFGRALGTSGQTNGVKGQTSSSTDFTAGVRGEAVSTTGQVVGVIGVSNSLVGGFGVVGSLEDTAGNTTVAGALGSAFGTATDTTGPPWGVFSMGNLGAMGAKHFIEPHPSDAARVIVYSSLEGREVGTYFRGTARVVNHEAVIDVPEDFRIVTDEEGLTVQLTPVGDLATLAVVRQDLNRVVVKASKDVTFHYLVQGVRRAFKDLQPVRIGYEFVPRSPSDTLQPYLTAEARRRLIANGTFNADGTVNMDTAERLGWAKVWRENGVKTKAAPLARPLTDSGTAEKK